MNESDRIDRVLDLTDKPKKKFIHPTCCIWWMGSVRPSCGAPLDVNDICFCRRHRQMANTYRSWREVPV